MYCEFPYPRGHTEGMSCHIEIFLRLCNHKGVRKKDTGYTQASLFWNTTFSERQELLEGIRTSQKRSGIHVLDPTFPQGIPRPQPGNQVCYPGAEFFSLAGLLRWKFQIIQIPGLQRFFRFWNVFRYFSEENAKGKCFQRELVQINWIFLCRLVSKIMEQILKAKCHILIFSKCYFQ